MTTAPHAGASLRERKRADTIEQIKAVALAQLAEQEGAMTLRAVARVVGMTVQSLYHYFPSRDDLITALVADAHNGLADAVDRTARAHHDGPAGEQLLRLTHAYRGWALEHRAEFLLAYGTPIPGYRAPEQGPTTAAARRLGTVFAGVVFAGWTAKELDRLPLPVADSELVTALTHGAGRAPVDLPPGAFAVLVELWGRMHGLVMLELLGHLPWLATPKSATAFYDCAMRRATADLEHLRRSG